MKTEMNFGASNRIFANAKSLRGKPTFGEIKLWSRLKKNQLGCKFRRQHPLSNYIPDFYCHELRLVIEVDGSIHSDKVVQIEDQNRAESILSYGITLIRFTNEEVLSDIDSVIYRIASTITTLKEKGPRLVSCSTWM